MLRMLVLSAVQGVVRVHLLEGRDLVAKDTYMMGLVKGKSDPYATLRVGNRCFKSKTIKQNLYPKWDEVYEVECFSGIQLSSLRQLIQTYSFVSKTKNLFSVSVCSLLSMKLLAKSWSWSYMTRTQIKTTLWEGSDHSFTNYLYWIRKSDL